MRKLEIGLDFDNVICDTAPRMWYVKNQYRMQQQLRQNSRTRNYPYEPSDEESYRYIQTRTYHEGNPLHLDWIKEANYYTHRLIRDGHSLSVITARTNAALWIAKEVLEIGGLNENNLKAIVGVGYPGSKASAAAELNLDVFFDDTLSHLVELEGIVPNRFLLSPRRRCYWEKADDTIPEDIIRINDWREFYQKLGDITISHSTVDAE